MTFWIAQAFSAIAVVLCFISFQVKNKNKLLILIGLGNFTYSIGFLILGAYFGFATGIIAALRSLLFYKIEDRNKVYRYFAISFLLTLLAVCTYFTYDGIISIFVMLAAASLALSMWFGHTIYIRFAAIAVASFLIIYEIMTRAYVSILVESIQIISCVIFLIRLYIERHHVHKDS